MVSMSLDHLRVVTNNIEAVVDLLVRLVALGDHLLHALLNVGGVHDGLAHGSGDLGLVLLGHLVTLVLHVILTLRSRGVSSISWLSISISLVVSTLHHLGVVANNSAAVVHLLAHLLAVLGHDLLTVLDVGGVDLDVVLGVALLPLLLDGLLLALLVRLAEALQVVVGLSIATWSSEGDGRHRQDDGYSEHVDCRISSRLLMNR